MNRKKKYLITLTLTLLLVVAATTLWLKWPAISPDAEVQPSGSEIAARQQVSTAQQQAPTARQQTTAIQQQSPAAQQQVPVVMKVETMEISETIDISGRLRADNRLEIFPEAAGKVLYQDKAFREGVHFSEGEILIRLDSKELELQIHSSRSGFQTLVASVLPDIRLDYPEYLELFEAWFDALDPEQPLPEPPDIDHRPLHRFLASRGVFDRYYQIKSSEQQLEKFVIRAPFPGVVAMAKVEPGQNTGPQQHIGTFVDSNQYILNASVRTSQRNQIIPGRTVVLRNQQGEENWEGTIRRINPSIDPQTQQVTFYLEVEGSSLSEGMYLEGSLETDSKASIARIPKSALHRGGHVYTLEDGEVRPFPVQIYDLERDYVRVRGLRDGQKIISDYRRFMNNRISLHNEGETL